MFNPLNFISKFVKSSNQKELDRIGKIVHQINLLEENAKKLNAKYLLMEQFRLRNWEYIQEQILWFLDSVNKVYLSVDMDGFSSAFAPGVSAPSPMGFSPQIAFRVFELIAKSKKLIAMDVVELNPRFDQDQATARLAARCVEYVLRKNFE